MGQVDGCGLFVCGDTHGIQSDTVKIGRKRWPKSRGLSKENGDTLVILGDFGWLWYPHGTDKEQEWWLDNLSGRNYRIAVVPGNHENYDLIESLPVVTMWNGPVRVLERKNGSIFFFERGYVYRICGFDVFVVGGAESVDRHLRIEGASWWRRELLSKEEEDRCVDNLEKAGWKVDFVFSHAAPKSVAEKILGHEVGDPVSKFLEFVSNRLEFREWHFGHLHADCSLTVDGRQYFCHYNEKPVAILDFFARPTSYAPLLGTPTSGFT